MRGSVLYPFKPLSTVLLSRQWCPRFPLRSSAPCVKSSFITVSTGCWEAMLRMNALLLLLIKQLKRKAVQQQCCRPLVISSAWREFQAMECICSSSDDDFLPARIETIIRESSVA
eukprot:4065872-Amphidinium_carterae.1